MKLIVALVCLTITWQASGSLLGTARCTYGPSYWCSSFAAARECSTTEHCVKNYWTKGNTPISGKAKSASETACTFCKDIVNDVHNFIADNDTRTEVLNYLNQACNYMPDEFSQNECKKIEEYYLDEFLALLEEKVDADTICKLIHLCASTTNQQLPAVQHGSEGAAGAVGGSDTGLCDACKSAEQFVKSEIDNTDNQAAISKMLEAECQKLGGDLAAECQTLVTTMIPVVVGFIDDNLNSQLCVMLHMCDANTTQVVTAAARSMIRHLKDSWIKKHVTGIASRIDADYCTICEEIFNYVHIILNNNATAGEVKDFLENTVCTQLGELASECKEVVEQYFPQLWDELLQLLDAKTVCTELGLCNATSSVLVRGKAATQTVQAISLVPAAEVKLEASPQCVICEFIMEKLEDELLTNATEEEIVAAVEKVCSLLPASISAECKSFIDKYGAIIIHLLETEVSPQTVCTLIGLCASKNTGTYDMKLGDENCIMCEMAVAYLKNSLSKNATEQELITMMEKLCEKLSQDLAQQCDAMIEQFAPKIFQILANEMDAKTLCAELGLCPAAISKAPKADGLVHLINRASNV